MTFQALFQPEIEHVIEFEQSTDLIIYAETTEPLSPEHPSPEREDGDPSRTFE